MLIALQFKGFKQDEILGFCAHAIGGTLFRSKPNKDHATNLDYRQGVPSSGSTQVFIPSSRSFNPYPRKLSWPRSQAKLEGKTTSWIEGGCSDGFVERLRRHSYERWCSFRIYVPCIISPIRISFLRELYRRGYDLINNIISKLKY
jgi:hypothetical protein